MLGNCLPQYALFLLGFGSAFHNTHYFCWDIAFHNNIYDFCCETVFHVYTSFVGTLPTTMWTLFLFWRCLPYDIGTFFVGSLPSTIWTLFLFWRCLPYGYTYYCPDTVFHNMDIFGGLWHCLPQYRHFFCSGHCLPQYGNYVLLGHSHGELYKVRYGHSLPFHSSYKS